MSSDPGSPQYKLVISGVVMRQLRDMVEIATTTGRLEQYRAVLLEVNAALTDHPSDWGDPQYQLHELGLTVYQRLYQG